MPPSSPPPSGNNTKLIAIGLVLLLGAGGLGFALLKSDPPPPPTVVRQVEAPAPAPTPSAMDDIEIPDVPPDMDVPDVGPAGCPEGTERRGNQCIRFVKVGGGESSWDCSGNIDPARIRSAVAEHSSEVRSCYERGLKANNTLQGTVRIRLKIGANGAVQGTNVGGSLRDNAVFSCVRQVADRWRFPNPTGGACAVVEIPYSMTPNR